MQKLTAKKIIVRMPNWIGDVVMATPILTDLRTAYPKASITAIVVDKLAPMLDQVPAIDELIPFSKSRKGKGLIKKLKEGSYDLGILLTNSFSSAWQFWRGGVKKRVGFSADVRRLLLDPPVLFPKKREAQHLVLTYKHLLEHIGIPISQTVPHLFIKKKKLDAAHKLISRFTIPKDAPIIGICPSAAYGPAKCWIPERFREVALRLTQRVPESRVFFLADASHKSLIDKICLKLPKTVLNLAGQTDLGMLVAIISLCSVFLANDSGPMHIADSLGVPVIALFGSTDPIVSGPYRQRGAFLQRKVVCSPCFKKVCPIDFPCMKGISVEHVLNRILDLLAKRESLLKLS